MPRIAEVDEPLAVDALGHLLQELDPAAVVLDEVVVGGEDGGDLALVDERWNRNCELFRAPCQCFTSCTSLRDPEQARLATRA